MNQIKFLLSLVLIIASSISYSQVGIGTTSPDASAVLDLESTNKGLLPPRMTEAFRDAITTPVAGLMVWCTNCGTNGEMQVYNGSAWTNMCGGATLAPIQVGDFTEGGVVFYIFLNGDPGYVVGETHGLVCEVQDQSSGTLWYNGSYTTTGATATGIGAGQTNTTTIINNQGVGTYAASVCDNHSVTVGGITYNDWFLSSKDELNIMYQNKATIDATATSNGGSSFIAPHYWSSSECFDLAAWIQRFDSGSQYAYTKNFAGRVRAVRAF